MVKKRRWTAAQRKESWDEVAAALKDAPLAQVRETTLLSLGFAAERQGWHYLEMLSVAAAEKEHDPAKPWFYEKHPGMRALHWSLNLRLNTALEVSDEAGPVPGRGRLVLPARGPFDFWLYRVTEETLIDQLKSIAIRGSLVSPGRRAEWIKKELLRRCGRLDGDLRRGAFDGIYHHHVANDTAQWRRNARACPAPAVHIRLHFGTGHMFGKIIVGELAHWSTAWLLPTTSRIDLIFPRRNFYGYHHTARAISHLAYNTLRLLNDPQSGQRCVEEMLGCYDWTLRPLLEHPRIARAIAKLGERPTLVITTHGALAQLPFAAFHDDIGFLGERFDVVQASPLPLARGERRLTLDVDSVSGGSPMQVPFPVRVLADTKALPQVRHEVAHYRKLAAAGSQIDICDANCTWSADRLRWLFGGAGVGILSSHVEASADRVAQTFVVTPDDSRLSIADALPERCGLSLAVLAACRSAAPIDWFGIDGGGIVTSLRMSNVKSVVATLWDVEDLAARLYNETLLDGLAAGATRARAHGNAMRHVMGFDLAQPLSTPGARGGDTGTDNSHLPQRLDHPFYWAPFTLCGAWL